jgi:hypothetical protein
MLKISYDNADNLEKYLITFFNNYVSFILDCGLPIEEFSFDLNISYCDASEKELIYKTINALNFEYDLFAIADQEFLTIRKTLVE